MTTRIDHKFAALKEEGRPALVTYFMGGDPDYETSLETKKEPLFYTLPQQRLPLKPPPEIFEYRNPENPV